MKNDSLISLIDCGKNPDAILLEPFTKMIITCNGGSNDLSIIDPQKNRTMFTVAVGGKPETAVADGEGRLFVNIEDKNEIVVVDLRKFTVVEHWQLQPGEEPTGLVLDKAHDRLFAGCGNGRLVVLNSKTGAVVALLPIGEGCDGVAFDTERQLIFTSNGDGTLSVIHQQSGERYISQQALQTKRGARTICIDPTTHLLYLPTADFQPPENSHARPKMSPGTFQVLVIGKTVR